MGEAEYHAKTLNPEIFPGLKVLGLEKIHLVPLCSVQSHVTFSAIDVHLEASRLAFRDVVILTFPLSAICHHPSFFPNHLLPSDSVPSLRRNVLWSHQLSHCVRDGSTDNHHVHNRASHSLSQPATDYTFSECL